MRRVAIFLVVAFAFSWALGLVLFLLEDGHKSPLLRAGLLTVYMFGPALGAVVAQRAHGEALAGPLAVTLRPNRWWLVAWLAPLGFAVATAVVSLLMPGVSPAFDFSGLVERLAPQLTPEQLGQVRSQLSSMPAPALVAVLVLQALVAGISINALAAFGEELGWRGLLAAPGVLSDRFWVKSVVVGALWGLWHAPIILQGHNYPEHPVIGVFMMIAWCVLLAPSFQLIRERGGSVWAAAILHGTLNASAGFALLFVKGGNDLTVGVTGLAGFLVLGTINAVIAVRRG